MDNNKEPSKSALQNSMRFLDTIIENNPDMPELQEMKENLALHESRLQRGMMRVMLKQGYTIDAFGVHDPPRIVERRRRHREFMYGTSPEIQIEKGHEWKAMLLFRKLNARIAMALPRLIQKR